MKTQQGRRNIWIGFITFIMITTMLCQNIAYAERRLSCQTIAPKSIFENFDKYFNSKGIALPFHIKSKIFLGFKEISERIFPSSPQKE